MENLKDDLNNLNASISELERQIVNAEKEAQDNIKPLKEELSKIRKDKRHFASKNDFDSIQECNRKENNIKFKITAQSNRSSLLKDELFRLKKQREELEYQIGLEKDKIKRNDVILSKMKMVLKNYEKSQNLTKAAIESNISPNNVKQWYEWGKNDLNQIYSYFYTEIAKIDNRFKEMEAQKLKSQMDDVIRAYKKTKSLKRASEIANVSYDTVKYWYDWGSRGLGEETTYFFKNLK